MSPGLLPSLRRRDPSLEEAMDQAECDPEVLARTYRSFPFVNRYLARWPALYRRYLRPRVREVGRAARGGTRVSSGGALPTLRILDVGCGGGDILRLLTAMARRDGVKVEAVGIDPDSRAVRWARAAGQGKGGVTFHAETAQALLARGGGGFHLVVSNHVLHHLPDEEVVPFCSTLEALALPGGRVLLSDIERSRLGYILFSAGMAPLFRDSFIRADGLVSIRRSYRRRELARVVPPGWKVLRGFPFRLLVLRDREHPGGGDPSPQRTPA